MHPIKETMGVFRRPKSDPSRSVASTEIYISDGILNVSYKENHLLSALLLRLEATNKRPLQQKSDCWRPYCSYKKWGKNH